MSKRIAAALCVAFFAMTTTTGCIGGMAVSGKVREFNLSVVEGKWAREGVFLLLYFIPVYPIAGFIDLIVVNSIEFHSGTNPVSGKARIAQAGETRREVGPDGTVALSTLREDGSVDVQITTPDGNTVFMNFLRDDARVTARDAEGNELGFVTRDGALSLSAL
jgi:hypothetical protein